jgi:hypothetical protein
MIDQGVKNVLVINALNGTLPLVLQKKYPSARITCAEVFPFYKHHLRNLGFEVVDWETMGDMKFDLIVGNPPYQLTSSKKLWPDFINQGLDLLVKDGCISMVVPSTWLTSDGAAYKRVRTRLTTDHNLIMVDRDADSHFTVGQDICCFVARCEPHTGTTAYKHNGSVTQIDLTLGIPRNAQEQITDSIIQKMIDYQPKIHWTLNERDDCIKSADIHATQTKVFKYKVWQSTANVGYVKQQPMDHGKLKLAVNFSSAFYSASADHGNMPITTDGIGSLMGYVLINNTAQGERLRSYLRSKCVRFMVNNYKKTHTGFNTAVKRRMIPQVPDQTYTDAELYKLFGFSQSEIEFIEQSLGRS